MRPSSPTKMSIALVTLLLTPACGPASTTGAITASAATVAHAGAAPGVSAPPADAANDRSGAGSTSEARSEKRRADAGRRAAESLYEKALTDIAAATCPAQDAEVCAWASGFLAGERPRFGSTEAWTLGTEAVVSDHGERESKSRYTILRTKRDGKATWLGTFSAFPETPSEEEGCRAALVLVAAGDTTTRNPFADFIRGNLDQGPWVEAAFEGKSLYFTEPRDRGSLIALRQKGDVLYVAQLIVGGGPAGWDLRPGWVLGSASQRPLLGGR